MPNEIDYRLIGNRIKQYRKKAGLSQDTLGRRLNYTAGYISQIERGQTRPNLNTIASICNELECDVTTILSTTNSTPDYLIPEFQLLIEQLDPNERRTLHALISAYLMNRNRNQKK